jgi:hypothetical protein
MKPRPTLIAVSGIALAAQLLAANIASAQQVSPMQRSPQSPRLISFEMRQTGALTGGPLLGTAVTRWRSSKLFGDERRVWHCEALL